MNEIFEKPAVVVDNGSYDIKAGFSCDNHPVSIFRNLVGRPSYLNGSLGKQYYDVFIGDEAVENEENLDLNHPVVNGEIVNWDNMERVWHHIFYRELKVAPEDRAVMLASSVASTIDEKIKCCEIFLETLNAPAICIQPQGVLAIYGSGYTTGISVDLGYDTTDIIPVFEGGLVKYAHMRTGVAGKQINNYLKELIIRRGMDLGPHTDCIVDDIKRRLCYLSQDATVSMNRQSCERKYTLPSGEVIDVSTEVFEAAETIFQPNLTGVCDDCIPLAEAIVTSALKCDAELRIDLYEAIVPCGGLSTMPGLMDRLTKETSQEAQRPVQVITSEESHCVSWLGASTFAGLTEAAKIWVMKKQFEEYGPKIVRNKFL